MRWIRNTFFPIRDAQGQIRRAGGIAQDITRHEGRFVYVVDGEETTRQDLSRFLRDAGYRVRVFSSGKAFLEAAPALAAGCVVLDIRRSGAGGLAIPRELKARRIGLPVIVLGDAQGDVTFGVQVMKAGAVDFLPVPYGSDQLLAAVASAAAGTRDEDEQNQEGRPGAAADRRNVGTGARGPGRPVGRQDQQGNRAGHRPQSSHGRDTSGPCYAAAWRTDPVASGADRNLRRDFSRPAQGRTSSGSGSSET